MGLWKYEIILIEESVEIWNRMQQKWKRELRNGEKIINCGGTGSAKKKRRSLARGLGENSDFRNGFPNSTHARKGTPSQPWQDWSLCETICSENGTFARTLDLQALVLSEVSRTRIANHPTTTSLTKLSTIHHRRVTTHDTRILIHKPKGTPSTECLSGPKKPGKLPPGI